MNFNAVVSQIQAADLSGKENLAVKLTSTGINIASSGDKVIGTLRRAAPKPDYSASAVGKACDVYLNKGHVSYATLGATSAAIALGAGLIMDTNAENAGKLLPSESSPLAIAWQAIGAAANDSAQIQVLWL